jgi:hypothetical protein
LNMIFLFVISSHFYHMITTKQCLLLLITKCKILGMTKETLLKDSKLWLLLLDFIFRESLFPWFFFSQSSSAKMMFGLRNFNHGTTSLLKEYFLTKL